MATFSQSVQKRLPPATFSIKTEHWASSYQDRPLVDMPVGLRMLSDEELDSCRADADRVAKDKLQDGPEAYIKAHEKQLMISAVSRALCMPDDSTKAHEHFPCPDDQLAFALRPETIVTLFDVVERVQLENSPVIAPASNEDIADLMESLGGGSLDALEITNELKAARIRRLFAFCLSELTDAG